MADLERMPQRADGIDRQFGSTFQPMIAAACEAQRRAPIGRKQLDEVCEALSIETLLVRKLPEHRPELVPQIEYPGGEKIRERRVHFAQALMWVMKRGPFTANSQSSGVASNHRT